LFIGPRTSTNDRLDQLRVETVLIVKRQTEPAALFLGRLEDCFRGVFYVANELTVNGRLPPIMRGERIGRVVRVSATNDRALLGLDIAGDYGIEQTPQVSIGVCVNRLGDL
jgi:hypothetical protein